MKKLVISYSLTGNNEALASSIAKEIEAEHIKISEPKNRTIGTIAFDMLFNRVPNVEPEADILNSYDLVIFCGPVWMGSVAAPIRKYLKYIKSNPCKYAYVSISGGADGKNPRLISDLTKRTGTEPVMLVDMHIVDLLPVDSKPTREDTSKYVLNEKDVDRLTLEALKKISDLI